MKIAINRCYGGFQLSNKAIEMLMKRKGLECYRYIWDYKDEKYHKLSSFETEDTYLAIDYSIADLGDCVENIPDEYYWYYRSEIERTDKDLIEVIEELGEEVNGSCGDIRIIEIPDNVDWEINDYDGIETVHEKHRSWY